MNIDHKRLRQLCERNTEPRPFTITGIGSNPSKIQAVFTGMLNYLPSKLNLCVMFTFIFWNAGSVTPFSITGPFPGKKQTYIHRRNKSIIGKGSENGDLAIVYFAKTAKPLPGS